MAFRPRDKGTNILLTSLPPSSNPNQEKDTGGGIMAIKVDQSSSFIAGNRHLSAPCPFSGPSDSTFP